MLQVLEAIPLEGLTHVQFIVQQGCLFHRPSPPDMSLEKLKDFLLKSKKVFLELDFASSTNRKQVYTISKPQKYMLSETACLLVFRPSFVALTFFCFWIILLTFFSLQTCFKRWTVLGDSFSYWAGGGQWLGHVDWSVIYVPYGADIFLYSYICFFKSLFLS